MRRHRWAAGSGMRARDHLVDPAWAEPRMGRAAQVAPTADTTPGPCITTTRVRLPIDDLVDELYDQVHRASCPEEAMDLLAAASLYVREGVMELHRRRRTPRPV